MPKLLNLDSFCEDLPEITTEKYIYKNKFHPEGLFSEQIFGPLKNYTCQCKKYHGVSADGQTCPICNVPITNTIKRRRQFAKIHLPIRIMNPIFYDLLLKIGGSEIKKLIEPLMKNELSVLYITERDFLITTDGTIIKDAEKFEKAEAIEELITRICLEDPIKYKHIQENIDKIFINNVLVLPPELRPASANNSKFNDIVVDKLNRYYTQILMKVKGLNSTIINIHNNKELYYYYFKGLQRNIMELYAFILETLSKKNGLIRGNILGKRIDFSGRAVIVPDPSLNLDECIIPYIMFLELYKSKIIQKLIEIGKFKYINKAIDFIDECIKMKNPALLKICEYISKDEVCILNRQPSLHRLGAIAFKLKVEAKMYMLSDVIRIHPLCCHGYNADFDGDQMAVHIPISEITKQEIRDKFLVTKNLFSPSDTSISVPPSQDIILGIYALTAGKIKEFNIEKEYRGVKMLKGLYDFNNELPDDFRIIDYPVAKKELIEILNEIIHLYPEDIVIKTLDKIKNIGFVSATFFGPTLSLDLCYIEGADELKEYLYESNDLMEMINRSADDSVTELLKNNFEYAYFVDSGARGNWDQIKQIVLTRGFISNSRGEIIPKPIKNSLISGLEEIEFFHSTYGERKGLLDVALNTGLAGYLSRKLIFSCVNQELDLDLEDCGTTDTIDVEVNTKRKAQMLVYRYHIVDGKIQEITKDNCLELLGKTIKLRSPIKCTSEKLCKTCYGKLYEYLDSRYVGVISAQTLGEVGTQLTLRTFHLSGSANLRKTEDGKVNLEQTDIISDLKKVVTLLHQFEGKTYKEILKDLFEVYNENTAIFYIHFECVISQLMWYQNTKWRLLTDRNNYEPTYHSIQTVPKFESWLLALAFSSPKQSILNGLVDTRKYEGIIDKILLGKRLN